MLLMQYRFHLEDEHDMDALRERISLIGPGFNAIDGLVQKAFLVSNFARGGHNRYAPFYVWQDEDAMRAFLLSDAFARVCAKYGRPTVHAWLTILSKTGGPSPLPRQATQEFVAIDPSTDLNTVVSGEQATVDAAERDGALHSIHIGLDTIAWQLVRTCLSPQPPATARGIDAYDVAYLAFPGRECLSA